MNDRQRAEVATDGLRELRDYLRGDATDMLQAIRANVDDALLPTGVWGVRLAGAVGALPEPDGHREPQLRLEGKWPADADPDKPSTWHPGPFGRAEWADDPLTAFKKNYEAAHTSAVARLGELIGIFDEIATTMDRVANFYDEMEDEGIRDAEGVDPG